jgi:hypothetical protein
VKEKKTARFPFLQCRLRATCSRVFLAKKRKNRCFILLLADLTQGRGSWMEMSSQQRDGESRPHCSKEPGPLRRQAQGQWLAMMGKTTSLPGSSQRAVCSRCSSVSRRCSGGPISLLRTRALCRNQCPYESPPVAAFSTENRSSTISSPLYYMHTLPLVSVSLARGR